PTYVIVSHTSPLPPSPSTLSLHDALPILSRSGKAGSSATARSDDPVQVYVVGHLVVGMVPEMKLHRIALTNPDETSGYGAAERPEGISHSLRDLLFDLADLELHDDLRRS